MKKSIKEKYLNCLENYYSVDYADRNSVKRAERTGDKMRSLVKEADKTNDLQELIGLLDDDNLEMKNIIGEVFELNSKTCLGQKLERYTSIDLNTRQKIIELQSKEKYIKLHEYAKSSYLSGVAVVTDMLDRYAEKIWIGRDAAEDYAIEAIYWCMKILEKSNNSRYRSFFENIIDEARAEKIIEIAKNSLNTLPEKKVAQYNPDK